MKENVWVHIPIMRINFQRLLLLLLIDSMTWLTTPTDTLEEFKLAVASHSNEQYITRTNCIQQEISRFKVLEASMI